MADKRITIVLELDEVEDCPVGCARLPEGAQRTFHGWLGLAEAIDSLASVAASPASATPPADEGAGR